MAKKLYVGNLSYNVTDDQLREHFAQAGNVSSAQVIMDRMSGRSKGFGFVEMASDEEALKAIETLNGQEMAGRALVVNEARPMTDRPKRTGGFGGGRDRGGFGGGRGGSSSW
ncbi:MAG: RNA-binding protein [Patescibacteria group bacterium]